VKIQKKIEEFLPLPEWLEEYFVELAELTHFTGTVFRQILRRPFENKELLRQAYDVGYKSLPLVGITGFILGLVLTLQSRPVLVEFGAEAWLPGMVSVSIIREIGPVITALIFAGKVGSSIGAELGSMRVTEQIDAMEVSGTNPVKFIVVTRVLATTFMLPILVFFADAISLYGSYMAVNINSRVSLSLFFNQAFDSLNYYDIIPATIKTVFFGFAVGIIGCFKGYFSDSGTEGVGKAANSAVVTSSLVIFVIDLIAVQVSELFSNMSSVF
jgi:phospholipid/cholesterol/gamma-HCH transport system permease protein